MKFQLCSLLSIRETHSVDSNCRFEAGVATHLPVYVPLIQIHRLQYLRKPHKST